MSSERKSVLYFFSLLPLSMKLLIILIGVIGVLEAFRGNWDSAIATGIFFTVILLTMPVLSTVFGILIMPIKALYSKQKPLAIALVTILVFSFGYVGIGFVISVQALTAKPGCGMWDENTPANWTSDDNWKGFEPWPEFEKRVQIRRDFNVSQFQMDDYEEVSFNPRDDSIITLRGWYVEVDPEAPVVILTHGMPVNGKCKPEMLLMQGYLSEGGFNTLSFDLRNYGESDVVSDYFAVGQIEFYDILGAYDWLVEEKGYNAGEVGMTAFSAGGGAAIAFAEEEGIGALWFDSAVLDFPLVVRNELGRMGYPEIFAGPAITVGSWLAGVDIDGRSPMEAADDAGDRPVYLTHGKEDVRVSIEHAERFEKRMSENDGNVSTWYVEDRSHVDAIWGESDEYRERLVTFFENALE
jgi:acetyl esterase/lipase